MRRFVHAGLRESSLILAVLFGALVRTNQIAEQILLGDEWHALRAQHMHDYGWILTHVGYWSFCTPLALYDKVLADTVGLSELLMRLPAIASGVALLAVVPLLVRPVVGRGCSNVFAWLLAVSPLLVFHSRFARPYAIALLLSWIGLLCAWRWIGGRGIRWGRIYAACAAGCAFFVPIALPFVGAPLVVAGAASTRSGKRPGPSWREVLGLGAGIGAVLLILLGIPFWNDWGAVSEKVQRTGISIRTLIGVLELTTGSGAVWLQAGVLAVALLGAIRLARRRGSFAVLAGACAAAQVLAVLLVAPLGGSDPPTFARYELALLPLLLLCVAAGLSSLDARIRLARGSRMAGWLPLLAVLVLFLLGPLPRNLKSPNAWVHHQVYQEDYDDDLWDLLSSEERERAPPSAFYDELAELEPRTVTILEAPWTFHPRRIFHPGLQALHRQEVRIGFVDQGPMPEDSGSFPHDPGRYAFRNLLDVREIDHLRSIGIDLVVFHRSIPVQTKAGRKYPRTRGSGKAIRACRRQVGEPTFEDETIVVFDLRSPDD